MCRLLLVSAVVLLLGMPPAGAGAQRSAATPTTRQSLAGLIASLSEPGGYFDTDNLISNERSYLHVVLMLRSLARQAGDNGVYLGVGPDQNFSYIAHLRPTLAILIDIRRDNSSDHLTFGYGSHQCMGKNLARMEMQIFLEEVTRRIPHMKLSRQTFTYVPNTSFRGPEHLWVEWDPALNPERRDRSLLDVQVPAIPLMKRFMKPQDHYTDIAVHDNVTCSIPESRSLLATIGIAGEIVHTPGHSDDSVSLLLDDGSVFTGDLTLPSLAEDRDRPTVVESWRLLRARGALVVYPGHGPARPIGR